jgi:hypothetical protein
MFDSWRLDLEMELIIYMLSAMDLRALGKRTSEWDLNDWKWDGGSFHCPPIESGAIG